MKTGEANPTLETTNAITKFFGALDARRYDEAAGLMAADGTWHRQGALLEGPSEVRAALEQRPLDLTTVHTLSNVLVQSSAGGLQLTFIGTVYSHRGEPSGEPMKATAMQVSRYTCGLSPEPDGWRIKSLTSEIIFRS